MTSSIELCLIPHLDTLVETYTGLENTAALLAKMGTPASLELSNHLTQLAAGQLMLIADLQTWAGGAVSDKWMSLHLAVPGLRSLDGRLRAVQAAKHMTQAGLDSELFLIRQFKGQEIET